MTDAHGLPFLTQHSLPRAMKEKIQCKTAKVCSLYSHGTNHGVNNIMLAPLLALEPPLSSAVVGETCLFLMLPEVA